MKKLRKRRKARIDDARKKRENDNSMVTDEKVTWKHPETFLRKQGESPGHIGNRAIPPISAKMFLGASKSPFYP